MPKSSRAWLLSIAYVRTFGVEVGSGMLFAYFGSALFKISQTSEYWKLPDVTSHRLL